MTTKPATEPETTAEPATDGGAVHATAPPPPKPGELFHFLVTGFTFMRDHRETSGVVSTRGQEFTVTEAMLDANRGREGSCFLDLLHDPDAQRRIGAGRLLVAPGPWPDDLERTEPGTPEHADARDEARRAAAAIPDKDERTAAMQRVVERFGPAGTTSTTLADYKR